MSASLANDAVMQVCLDYLDRSFADRPDLKAKLTPDFAPFAKRIVKDPGFFEALKQDHVCVHRTSLAEIRPDGVVTTDGQFLEADVIIWATGFKLEYLSFLDVIGRDGLKLADAWTDQDPRAYLGVTVPGFPNLFVTAGPNAAPNHGGGHNVTSEEHVHYLVESLQYLVENGLTSMEPTRAATDAYNQRVDEQLDKTVWQHAKTANGYYRNASGRAWVTCPWRLVDYWSMLRAPAPSDYAFTRGPATGAQAPGVGRTNRNGPACVRSWALGEEASQADPGPGSRTTTTRHATSAATTHLTQPDPRPRPLPASVRPRPSRPAPTTLHPTRRTDKMTLSAAHEPLTHEHQGWSAKHVLALIPLLLIIEVLTIQFSMVGIALPRIAAYFSTTQVAWTFTATAITGAALSPIFGKLADIYGKRKVLLVISLLGTAVRTVGGGTQLQHLPRRPGAHRLHDLRGLRRVLPDPGHLPDAHRADRVRTRHGRHSRHRRPRTGHRRMDLAHRRRDPRDLRLPGGALSGVDPLPLAVHPGDPCPDPRLHRLLWEPPWSSSEPPCSCSA